MKDLGPPTVDDGGVDIQRMSAWHNLSRFSGRPSGEGETLAGAIEMRLKGSRLMAARRAALTRAVYRSSSRVAAVSLLVPHEVAWAAGFLPFDWEMFASLLASDTRVAEVCNRGKEQTPRCSFLDTLKGAHLEGILPKPDVMVSSSAFCAGIGTLFEEISESFSTSHLHLDIPTYPGRDSVDFLGRQIHRVFDRLCEMNGIGRVDGERRLRRAIELSAVAQAEYLEVCRIRRDFPGLDLSLEPMFWHFLFFPFWGTEDGVEICRTLKTELAELGPNAEPPGPSRIPVAVFSLYPYGRTEVWQRLLNSGIYTAFEGVNWLRGPTLPPADRIAELPIERLFDDLASNLIDAPMRGGYVNSQAEEVMQVIRDHGARGMLIFSHDQCQMIASRLSAVEDAAARAGAPVCVVNGDCILGVPLGPAGLRLTTFVGRLGSRPPRPSSPTPRTPNLLKIAGPTGPEPELAVGIDFGSGFSKYVAVDCDMQVVDQGLAPSGIDYPALLQEIVERIPSSESRVFAMAGVGSDNPLFGRLVELQTSEIDALIAAVRHLYGHRDSLLVVDIGTQDVKVLHFENLAAEPWCATNKSCGAGTGSVLVQVLERWQQSEPEMTYEQLDELAFDAERGTPINTTCGIFAVTNVVSSLVQADVRGRKEILRGLYGYVAAQATRHFPPHLRSGGELLAVGGIAGHRTLRKVFSEAGFELIELPHGLNPQHVVAYGAAAMLRQSKTLRSVS